MFSLTRDFSGSSSSTTLPDEDDDFVEDELRISSSASLDRTSAPPNSRPNLLQRMNAFRSTSSTTIPNESQNEVYRHLISIRSDSQQSIVIDEDVVKDPQCEEGHKDKTTATCCGSCHCSEHCYESFQVIYYPPFEMPYFPQYQVHPLIHPYLHLPFAITQIFNMGNHEKIRELLSEYVDEHCLFSSTAMEKTQTGVEYVYNFFEALLTAHPDCVLETKDFSYLSIPDDEHPDVMIRSINSSFTFVGTRRLPSTIQDIALHREYCNDEVNIEHSLQQEVLFKDPNKYLTDYMNPTIYSINELELLKEIERNASNIELVLHGKWTMYLENLTPTICPLNLYNDLIVVMEFDWEVSSFRNAGRPTIL